MDEQTPPLPTPPSDARYREPPALPADPGVAHAPVDARRGRWTRVAVGLGLAAGTAVGAAAISAAATGSQSPAVNTAASNSSGTAPADGPGPRLFGHGFGVGGPGVVHGQFTVNGPNGYENLQEQQGTVSSVSNTSNNTWSLTVQSADGQSYTYVVDSGTSVDGGETGISSIAKGDTVRVLAVVSNGTATAKDITDTSVLKSNGQSWMPQPPQPPSGNSSSTSGSSTSA